MTEQLTEDERAHLVAAAHGSDAVAKLLRLYDAAANLSIVQYSALVRIRELAGLSGDKPLTAHEVIAALDGTENEKSCAQCLAPVCELHADDYGTRSNRFTLFESKIIELEIDNTVLRMERDNAESSEAAIKMKLEAESASGWKSKALEERMLRLGAEAVIKAIAQALPETQTRSTACGNFVYKTREILERWVEHK